MSNGKSASLPHSPTAFPGGFNAHRLSTTEEEISNASKSSGQSGTSTATVIHAGQSTNDTAGSATPQAQSTATAPPKPPVSFHASGFKGAHASFRLRMLQEQHGFEPVSFTHNNPSIIQEAFDFDNAAHVTVRYVRTRSVRRLVTDRTLFPKAVGFTTLEWQHTSHHRSQNSLYEYLLVTPH
ncbi:unnamed protein product [Toxocara canis]|uniref:Uncharacterized protein n=1 Tax=Toxocara canis TaxID=6265 RepID=A0A183V6Z6_TOXCA|nr:unnamed protein product [Toxocara canis]